MKRPACDRCSRAATVCQGYPERSHASPALDIATPTPFPSLALDPRLAGRLLHIACTAVHSSNFGHHSLASTFWATTLPQLARTQPLVGAAAAALGAALDLEKRYHQTQQKTLLLCYAQAVEQMKTAVASAYAVSTATFAACVLLATTDILRNKESNAIYHLQGAMTILKQRQSKEAAARLLNDGEFRVTDEVDAAGVVLDVSTASYALSLEPRLSLLSRDEMRGSVAAQSPLCELEMKTFRVLNAAYKFAAANHQWKYVPARFHPKDTHILQYQFTGQLFFTCKDLASSCRSSPPATASRVRVLFAQCMSCLIYVSCLTEPRQTAYDRFDNEFEAIVTNLEAVSTHQASPSAFESVISFDVGVVQPAFFTASKCRHPAIRDRAIRVLKSAGREGPFDGKQLAVVARRVQQLEVPTQCPTHTTGWFVPELARLHSAGVDPAQFHELSPGHIAGAFSRCRDVEGMMLAEDITSFQDSGWWDIWNEPLAVPKT